MGAFKQLSGGLSIAIWSCNKKRYKIYAIAGDDGGGYGPHLSEITKKPH